MNIETNIQLTSLPDQRADKTMPPPTASPAEKGSRQPTSSWKFDFAKKTMWGLNFSFCDKLIFNKDRHVQFTSHPADQVETCQCGKEALVEVSHILFTFLFAPSLYTKSVCKWWALGSWVLRLLIPATTRPMCSSANTSRRFGAGDSQLPPNNR